MTRNLIELIVVFGLVTLLGACSDKGGDPKPVTAEYSVYVTAMWSPSGRVVVYKIDAQADSIVDSFYVGVNEGIGHQSISPDGHRLWFAAEDRNLVINTQDMSLYGTITGVGPILAFFDTDLDQVMGLAYWQQRILYYDPATLNVVDQDTMVGPSRWWEFLQDPKSNCLIGCAFRQRQAPEISTTELIYFDYRQERIVDSLLLEPGDSGRMHAYFELSPSASHIFCFEGQVNAPPWWNWYDARTGKKIFRTLQPDAGNVIFLNDDKRLVLAAPGDCNLYLPLSVLQIWDYRSKSLVGTIDLHWTGENDSTALFHPARDGVQVPGTNKLYVSAGSECGPGAILIVSLDHMRIEKALFSGQSAYFYSLSIGINQP